MKILIWGSIWTCFGLIGIGALVFFVQAARNYWKSQSKWAFMVTALYVMLVFVVFLPAFLFVVCLIGEDDIFGFKEFINGYAQLLQHWPWWVYCGFLMLCELSLLTVQVGKSAERPKPQRGIRVTALAAAALFAMLVLGIVWSIAVAIFGDDAIEQFAFYAALIFVVVNWLVWAWVFRRFAKKTDPDNYPRRLIKWLLRGSILELLVAVPSHIIVRQRDVCCAHMITATGIATGLAIMLLSFGPGIYFLYAERIKRKSNNKTKNQNQNQDDIPE